MNTNGSFVEEWQLELPDGTTVQDEIEYNYMLGLKGIQLVPNRNRRIVTHPDGEVQYVPVPENYEDNRKDLYKIIQDWNNFQDKHVDEVEKREKRYIDYISWMKDHLGDQALTTLLFSSAIITNNPV
jgi:hypothetical protein